MSALAQFTATLISDKIVKMAAFYRASVISMLIIKFPTLSLRPPKSQ